MCTPHNAGPDADPGLSTTDPLPEWLSELAPSLKGEEAERAVDAWTRCGEELRRRTRQFVRRATCGVPCWLIDQRGRRTVPCSYLLDGPLEILQVESAGPIEKTNAILGHSSRDGGTRHVAHECRVSEIRNIWICADNELARRAHGTLRHGCDADLACVMLIDAPSGPVGLVERSPDAREEFLDCMAVLVAAQRIRNEPEVACCRRTEGPPPPEARLRPYGKSLQSSYVTGPICLWLARAAEDLLPGQPGSSTQRFLSGDRNALADDPHFPGSGVCPPRAVAVHAGERSKDLQLLVDIDELTPEGMRGPVPLITPKWPSASSGRAGGSRPASMGASSRAASEPRRSPAKEVDIACDQAASGSLSARGASDGFGTSVAEKASPDGPWHKAWVEGAKLSDGSQPGNAGAALTPVIQPAVGVIGNMVPDEYNGFAGVDAIPASGPQSVREPPPSFDGMPMMMGGWVADQPVSTDPTILTNNASKHFVLPPGSASQYPHTL